MEASDSTSTLQTIFITAQQKEFEWICIDRRSNYRVNL